MGKSKKKKKSEKNHGGGRNPMAKQKGQAKPAKAMKGFLRPYLERQESEILAIHGSVNASIRTPRTFFCHFEFFLDTGFLRNRLGICFFFLNFFSSRSFLVFFFF